MKPNRRVLSWAGAIGALAVAAIVFGWHWVEREGVAVAASDAYGVTTLPGPAGSGGSMSPAAALATVPDCLAASFASYAPKRIARSFFVQLGEADALRRQLIADLAGIDVFADEFARGAEFAPANSNAPRRTRLDLLLPPVAGKHKTLGLSRQRPVEDALLEPTLDEFIAIAVEEPALMRRGWRHFGLVPARDDSVLGHALRLRGRDVLRRIHELPAAAFGSHELAVAMAQGIAPDDFLALIDRTDVHLKATWRARTFTDERHMLTRRYNLAHLAAVYARPRLLRVLLERGVALPARQPSVLDELSLSLSITQPAPDVLGDVAGQLAAAGERPYLPSTAARLAAVAPGIAVPGLHSDAAAALSSPDLREHAAQLAALVAGQAVEAEETRAIREHCRDARLTAGEAGAVRSLASKMAQDEVLRERKERSMRMNVEQGASLSSNMSADSLAFIAAMRAAFDADDWDEVFRILDEWAEPPEFDGQLVAGLLGHALYSGSHLDVVRELIARNGGTLPPRTILTLMNSPEDSALHVAVELEEWGLDAAFVDADGRNAVNHLMDKFRSYRGSRSRTLRWLDYLTSRSVSTQPPGPGLDPLDTVLFAVLDAPEATTVAQAAAVARALILAGASVQASHHEIATRIRAVAPGAYEALVEALPELRAT